MKLNQNKLKSAKRILFMGTFIMIIVIIGTLLLLLIPVPNEEDYKTPTLYCGTCGTTTTVCGNLVSLESKKLFKVNCASCHRLDKKSTGPAIFGMKEKFSNDELLYLYVINQDSLQEYYPDFYDSIFQDFEMYHVHKYSNITTKELEVFFKEYTY